MHLQTKRIQLTRHLSLKSAVGTEYTSFNASIGIESDRYGSETERTDGRQNDNQHLQFLVRLKYSFAVKSRLPS